MKKILAIDGGGIRGVIPAMIIAELEEQLGKPAATIFDLLAGTSTGGILALGLTVPDPQNRPKYSANELLEIYENKGREIFNRSFWQGVSSVAGVFDQKYEHDNLESILEQYFGENLLGAGLKPVLVSAYDIEGRSPLFFKSWRDKYKSILMRHAARATSAAPTYFEPTQVEIQNAMCALVDGGVFVNNITMCAYAEAKVLFPNENDFLIVSIGTGELTRTIPFEDAKKWGLAEWALPILNIVFDGVSDAVNYQLEQLVGDRYFRFQTSLDIASDDMDNASKANIIALKQEADQLLKMKEEKMAELIHILQNNS